MILCLDVGNTQIHGGVFDKDKLIFQFRKTSKDQSSSDEYGLFLKAILRENGVDPAGIQHIAFCSVVPSVVYSLRGACTKYFKLQPFVLQTGVKTGLSIKYKNPSEVGSDRIANAVAATHLYPDKNLIIVDFGTATTVCVVSHKKEYLGGAILPGIRISMEALESKTAKLPRVEIMKKDSVIGQTTVDSLQIGLYYGQMGMVREIVNRCRQEAFADQECVVLGTGGFSTLFDKTQTFDVAIPDLALRGLYLSLKLNQLKEVKNASSQNDSHTAQI
jgi:type III pantothenate kinase